MIEERKRCGGIMSKNDEETMKYVISIVQI